MPKFLSYSQDDETAWGVLRPDQQLERIIGDPVSGYERTGETVVVDTSDWLQPARPSKIIGVGLNYAEHAKESNKPVPDEPLLFLKPPSSLLPHDGAIRVPHRDHRTDHEAELAVVIGRQCRDVDEASWREYVAGFTCANDVSDRVLQRRDGQFTRAKGFDTFCPLGPYLVTDVDPSDLMVVCRLNGEVRQQAATSTLIFDVPRLISFISSVMTLEPWDVILTGTPAGVGPVDDGDVVEVEIQHVGTLRNRVVVER